MDLYGLGVPAFIFDMLLFIVFVMHSFRSYRIYKGEYPWGATTLCGSMLANFGSKNNNNYYIIISDKDFGEKDMAQLKELNLSEKLEKGRIVELQ